MSIRYSEGFSVVELLITIIVGTVSIAALAQIYGVVVGDASIARNKANASAIAYTQIRTIAASLSGTCVPRSSVTLPVHANAPAPDLSSLPSPPAPTITASVSCPLSTPYPNSSLSRITVTVTYGTEQVSHVLYTY